MIHEVIEPCSLKQCFELHGFYIDQTELSTENTVNGSIFFAPLRNGKTAIGWRGGTYSVKGLFKETHILGSAQYIKAWYNGCAR